MISVTQACADASIRKQLLLGTIVVFILLVGVGSWAALADISGAVIASGIVVVESNDKKVQHPTGGIVGELLVKDGDHVKAGDVVLRHRRHAYSGEPRHCQQGSQRIDRAKGSP